ncbi:hypothetical protein RvY_15165-2 [Ramazzottius varieornatus]|nr:hypothetical protein RvY_15165-2 [Ramazzottius varieornatus]
MSFSISSTSNIISLSPIESLWNLDFRISPLCRDSSPRKLSEMALFGRQAQQRGSSRYMVEFKAGRMTMEGSTVTADPRKGMVYVNKGDDDLPHFCWRERSATSPEEDLIIMPNDVELKKVPQCTTGRVFLLRVKATGRKLFYWMQEFDATKDEELFKKVQDCLSGKTPARSSSSGGDGGLQSDLQNLGIDDNMLQEILGGNVDRNQLAQLFSSSGAGSLLQGLRGTPQPATPRADATAVTSGTLTPAVARPTATMGTAAAGGGGAQGAPTKLPRPSNAAGKTGTKIQLSDLQNIFGSVQPAAQAPPVDWTSAFSQALLLPILSNPAFVQRLTPHLPQDALIPQTGDEVMNTVQSPQFQQAVQSFASAFETRQLGPLIQEFNLGTEAVQAANNGDFEAFVRALEKNKESQKATSGTGARAPGSGAGGPQDKPGNDDEEMSVD